MVLSIQAQEQKISLRDTIDDKLDASEFLIKAHGFIPIFQPITEPALGHFGLVLAPVFISPNKHPYKKKYTPPDITAAFAGYTLNHTWMIGALRIAQIPQFGIKYRVGGGYGNINLDFYREIANEGTRSFPFNFRAIPFFINVQKQIGESNLSIGIEYLIIKNEVTPEFEGRFDFFDRRNFKALQSSPGLVVEYDGRNSIFTPDRGTFASASYRINADWTGSDFNFQNFKFYILQYFQTTDRLISGFRFESQHQFNHAPFYLLPGLNMRGVPAAKYQGTSTWILQSEQRYDLSLRWSVLVFGGGAKAYSENSSFSDADLIYNYGAGFRYLIARAFNLRMGVDVASSNEDVGYYIVFGSFWR